MNIKEFASAYRKLNWNVIPLYHFSKNPAPLKWKEYEERMATDEEFDNWFNDSQVTGLGLIAGKLSGIVAVDEDSYKANGMAFEFVSPMVSRTARNGRHHFFRYTVPIKTSGFRQGVNIEIKSDGGFLVLPPSQVELNKVTKDKGHYEWLSKCHPNNLPTITEAQLLPYRGSILQQDAVELNELVYAKLGSQHNNLRSLALSVFNRFLEKEWDIAAEFIRTAARNFDPPHPEERIEKMIQTTMRYIQTHPKQARYESDEITRISKGEKREPLTTNALVLERIADRKLEAIAPSTGWPELDSLIKGFIPGHLYTLTGDTNVGKTTIAANFTEALREQGKKVLYIALEPDVNLVEYLASVRQRKPFHEVTDDELQVIGNSDEYVKVFLGRDIRTVEDLIEVVESGEAHYDLIIIDHIGYFVNSEKGHVQQQSNIVKQLAFLAKQQKMAVLLIAHLRKPDSRKKKAEEGDMWIPTQDDISGSAAFKQDSTEVMIAVRRHKPTDQFSVEFVDEGFLLVTKTKTGPNGVVPLLFSQRSALVLTRAQAMTMPQERRKLEEREQAEQQLRLGDATEDEWHTSS